MMENKKGNKFLFRNTLTALNVLERFILRKTSIEGIRARAFEVCRLSNMLGAFFIAAFSHEVNKKRGKKKKEKKFPNRIGKRKVLL